MAAKSVVDSLLTDFPIQDSGKPNIESASYAILAEVDILGDDTEFSHASPDDPFSAEVATLVGCEFDEPASIGKITEYIVRGEELLHSMYTYRSCSRAIPQVSTKGASFSREDYYRTQHEILGKEVQLVNELFKYNKDVSDVVRELVNSLISSGTKAKFVITDLLYEEFIRLLDVLLKLNGLKNMKAALNNDFSLYKRAQQQVRHDFQSLDAQVREVQMFLASQNKIVEDLMNTFASFDGYEHLMYNVLEFCQHALAVGQFTSADSMHRYIRVTALILYISFPLPGRTADGKESKHEKLSKFWKKTKVDPYTEIIRKKPVVPLYGDMSFEALKFVQPGLNAFGIVLREDKNSFLTTYSLDSMIGVARQQFDSFSARTTVLQNQVSSIGGPTEQLDAHLRGQLAALVLEGTSLIAGFTAAVLEQCAWKYTHPGKLTSSEEPQLDENGKPIRPPFEEYERVVKANYSVGELHTLVEMVAIIKSLQFALGSLEAYLPSLIEHVYVRCQNFAQNVLREPIRKAKKNGREKIVRTLKAVRQLLVDWHGEQEPDDPAMKGKKSKFVNKDIKVRRAVPSLAHIQRVRLLLSSLVCPRSPIRQKGSKEMHVEIADSLQAFCDEAYFFNVLLHPRVTAVESGNLGSLWFREFFLEITHSVQFPIDLSLPSLMVKAVLERRNSALMESVLYPLQLYSDAAHHALQVLKCQYLYDEIEAEMNLVFVQFIYDLSHQVFVYYKLRAASMILDAEYKQLAHGRKRQPLQLPKCRYETLLRQHSVRLLGRTVDLSDLIARSLNGLFRDNVEAIISRFESSSLTSVVELESLLKCVRSAHELLMRDSVALDPFATIFDEMNESVSSSPFDGRVGRHILSHFMSEFPREFIYNAVTVRFVPRSGLAGALRRQKGTADKRKSMRAVVDLMSPEFMYGTSAFNTAFSQVTDLYAGFFGLPHMSAIYRLVGASAIPTIVQTCIHVVEDTFEQVVPLCQTLIANMKAVSLDFMKAESHSFSVLFKEMASLLKGYLHGDAVVGNTIEMLSIIGNVQYMIHLIGMVVSQEDAHNALDMDAVINSHSTLTTSGDTQAVASEVTNVDDVTEPFVSGMESLADAIDAIVQVRNLQLNVHDIEGVVPVAGRVPEAYTQAMKGRDVRRAMQRQFAETVRLSDLNSLSHSPVKSQTGMRFECDIDTVAEVLNRKHFSSLVSRLFLLVSTDSVGGGYDLSRFGDGFPLACYSVIHALGEGGSFALSDLSTRLLQFVTSLLSGVEVERSSSLCDQNREEQLIMARLMRDDRMFAELSRTKTPQAKEEISRVQNFIRHARTLRDSAAIVATCMADECQQTAGVVQRYSSTPFAGNMPSF